MNISVADLFLKSAQRMLDSVMNGVVPNGVNGPYNDEETNIRNVSHWLIVMCKSFEITSDHKYRDAAFKLLNILMSEGARPMNASFLCRKNPYKDFCNGVMGQAWVIEALVFASKILDSDDAYNLAENVFLLHPFDERRFIWKRVNVDGSFGDFDITFNHQLWFAAMGSCLYKTDIAVKRAFLFLDNVAVNVELYRDGVIYHNSSIFNSSTEFSIGGRAIIDLMVAKLFSLKTKRSIYSKSVGYHSFNLYAFEILRSKFPEHMFFRSKKYEKLLRVADDSKFLDALVKSKYSYAYNPPGIEFAFALEHIGEHNIQHWLQRQFSYTYDDSNGLLMSKVANDVATLEARIYELYRINDLQKIVIEIPFLNES